MDQHQKVAIALGSNLGDRLEFLKNAAQVLADDFLENAQSSHVYQSPPWGPIQQPDFLNAVIVGLSEWKPPAILNYLKTLERELGRTAGVLFGPREIDLDLIAYAEQSWSTEGVVVPHPRMQSRDFVLVPFMELWPNWRHPESGKSVEGMWKALSSSEPSYATVFAPPLLSRANR